MKEQYEIESILEQTSKAIVYKAHNKNSGKQCLIKRYLVDGTVEFSSTPDWKKQFQSMIRDFSQTEHPSLRSVIDGGFDSVDQNPYVVFEWFNSSRLDNLMKISPNNELQLVQSLAKFTLTAVSFLHQNGLSLGIMAPNKVHYTICEEKTEWVLDWCPLTTLKLKCQEGGIQVSDYLAPEERSLGSQPSSKSYLYAIGKVIEEFAGFYIIENNFQDWVSKLTATSPLRRYNDSHDALVGLSDFQFTSQEVFAA